MLLKLVNKAACLFKGPNYKLDSRLPVSALISYSISKMIALLRCQLRGVVISLNPKKLIFLGANVELRNRRMIKFGAGVTLGKGTIINGLSRSGVSIGDNVSIGPYSIIEATGVISNIGEGLTIGANSGLGAYSFIGAAGGVKIGENVIMGQRISFHSENHNYDRLDIPIKLQGVTRKGITIEDDCWVGAGVIFLDGAHVGSGSIIAAGAVVRGTILPYSIVGGVPAKFIKRRGDA